VAAAIARRWRSIIERAPPALATIPASEETTNTQRFEADSLADEPVNGEPVCGSNSLLTGNLTGNFSNLGLFLRFSLLINEQIQMLAAKFPSKWNREFF
jgi:hypothetical protein